MHLLLCPEAWEGGAGPGRVTAGKGMELVLGRCVEEWIGPKLPQIPASVSPSVQRKVTLTRRLTCRQSPFLPVPSSRLERGQGTSMGRHGGGGPSPSPSPRPEASPHPADNERDTRAWHRYPACASLSPEDGGSLRGSGRSEVRPEGLVLAGSFTLLFSQL